MLCDIVGVRALPRATSLAIFFYAKKSDLRVFYDYGLPFGGPLSGLCSAIMFKIPLFALMISNRVMFLKCSWKGA